MFESWLFSPSRKGWVAKNKEREETCVFCEIARGNEKIPQRVLYRDESVMVLMNIYPYNTGHLLVVPTKHVENLEELEEGEHVKLWECVRKSVILLKEALKPVGFNIGINIGKVAGASIKHLHVHVVPRFETDFGFMEVTAGTKVVPADMEELFRELKKRANRIFTVRDSK